MHLFQLYNRGGALTWTSPYPFDTFVTGLGQATRIKMHNRGYSFVSRFKIQIEIYLLNEGLSNLVEVGIEGHLNLKARRLNVYIMDGVLGPGGSTHWRRDSS